MGPYIMYYSESNRAYLVLPSSYFDSGLIGEGLICNFPDFAKRWLRRENGLKVYIEGKIYVYNFPGFFHDVTRFGYMLTSIKKEINMKKLFKNPFAKVRSIVTLGIISTLLFAAVSCKKELKTGGSVRPCNKEMVFSEKQSFPGGKVFLFKNRAPEGFNIGMGPYIMYYSESNRAYLVLPSSYFGLIGEGFICNFPDFAKRWLRRENGLKVYIEGKMYYHTFPGFHDVIRFGYMLTSIKKK